jgi:uncharacterized protein YjbI with pentapeptide repeats
LVVVADLVLIAVMTYRCFFPRGVKKAPLVLGPLNRKARWATAIGFCALLALCLSPLAYWLSFQQGRWAGEPRPSSFEEWGQWMEGKPSPLPEANLDYSATANGVVFGLFPDRLQLGDETIVGKEKLERTKEEIASRNGDFVPTIKLDFRDLQSADLSGADLRGVSLGDAAVLGANLSGTRLDGARFIYTMLRGASLQSAQLQGADLRHAQLQGADLTGAGLQGADLRHAQLQGADLTGAGLQGADLTNAELQGADLRFANLQGADLTFANLQGTDLSEGTQLQGAKLAGAELQGADLRHAQLQGADLTGAGLQGADLSAADLRDSEFNDVFVFRANVADTNLSTLIRAVHADQVRFDVPRRTELSQPDAEALIAAATQFAKDKKTAEERFDRLKPDFQTAAQDEMDKAKWTQRMEQSIAADADGAHHRQQRASWLGDLACDSDGAPYVARAFIGHPDPEMSCVTRLSFLEDQLEDVRKRMKDGRVKPDTCKGVAGFTGEDWRRLDEIKPFEAAPADR